MTTYAESTDILAGGRWVPDRHGIQRWVPDPRFAPVVCPTCHATTVDWCRTTGGRTRHPHPERRGERTCTCGVPLAGKARYCEPCRVEVRRETWRAAVRRRYEKSDAYAAAMQYETEGAA